MHWSCHDVTSIAQVVWPAPIEPAIPKHTNNNSFACQWYGTHCTELKCAIRNLKLNALVETQLSLAVVSLPPNNFEDESKERYDDLHRILLERRVLLWLVATIVIYVIVFWLRSWPSVTSVLVSERRSSLFGWENECHFWFAFIGILV